MAVTSIHEDLPPEYEVALLAGYRTAVEREKSKQIQLASYPINGHDVYVKLSTSHEQPSTIWLYDNNKVKWTLMIGNNNDWKQDDTRTNQRTCKENTRN